MCLDHRGALPVAELTDVEVAIDSVDAVHPIPAQEDVAARLHQVLSVHHSFPGRPPVAVPDELLQHGRLGLFGLEEERIGPVATEHQDDPGPGADAADTDDLARHVDQTELLEQVSAVALQRPAVAANHAPQELVDLLTLHSLEQFLDRLDERWVADDASFAVDEMGEFVEGLQAVAGRALARFASARLRTAGLTALCNSLRDASMSLWSYHTARLVMAANSACRRGTDP